MATYELTEAEKRFGAIPGQRAPLPSTRKMLAESEGIVRAIAADREPYQRQFGLDRPTQPLGVEPPAQEMGPGRAYQKSWIGESGSGMTKAVDDQGRTTYTGVGNAPDTPYDPVAQLAKLQSIDPDKYGIPGAVSPRDQSYQAAVAAQEAELPDFGNMTIPQMAAWNAQNMVRSGARKQRGQMALEQMREAGQRDIEGMRIGGQRDIESMREQGALSRLGTEYGYRGAEAEKARAADAPYKQAQIGALQGQTAIAESGVQAKQRQDFLLRGMNDPDLPEQMRKSMEKEYMIRYGSKDKSPEELLRLRAAYDQELLDPLTGLPVVKKAEGGLTRGYADGGAVGRDLAQPAPQVNPLIAQYGQYLTAAASAGVPPVPFAQYQNLLQTTRASVQGQPPVGFADGGDVSALGRPLEGPGTGTSDSIPAVIDGQTPAALSKDEFVFPAEVTKYYGTKFMNDLIAKAKTAMSGEGALANG